MIGPFNIGRFPFSLGPSIQLAALSKTGLQPIRTVQVKVKLYDILLIPPQCRFWPF